MTIRIVAVGRLKEKRIAELAAHYSKRLRAPWDLEAIEVKEGRGPRPQDVQQREGETLLNHLDGRWVVALEEVGDLQDSVSWSETITTWHDQGKKLAFVIGGAHGLSDAVRERADAVWSLSPLTCPHEVARLLLTEQIYRAMTIANGVPYHK